MTDGRHAHRRLRASGAALAILVALFVVVRVVTAWIMRYEVNGDLAVVQMMLRDMLHGGPVPAFFSGQAYMGSLEPIVSAVLCRVAGYEDFSLAYDGAAFCASLGPALFMLLAAIFTCRVARRIGGGWAGVAALALLVVGPMPFVHYSVSQRGGYGVLLFTVAALIDMGGALVASERRDGRAGFAAPLFAGLVLGVGFWCNQLLFPAALAVGAGLALFAPSILLRWRLWLGGVIGFAIGSLPFWFWNAHNEWESFRMASGLVMDMAVFARNLLLLVVERIPMLLGVDPRNASLAMRLLVSGAAAIAMLLSLVCFAPPPRRIDVPFSPLSVAAKAQLTICWLFFFFFAVCFATSNFAIFATPRYLLATLPAVAAVMGAACVVPRFRSARIASTLCMVLLVAFQAWQYPRIVALGRSGAVKTTRCMEATKVLRAHSVRVAYCAFRHNTMNLCTDPPDHEPVFTDSVLERRPDFRHLAETYDSPAVVGDFLGLARWIPASGGTATFESPCGIHLAYDVRPPSQALAEIEASEWADADDDGPLRPIGDRSIGTSRELPGKTATVTVSFRSPQTLSCVRALVSGIEDKASCRVEGRESSGAPFKRLSTEVPYVRAIWSGPRFYTVNDDAPFDIHFAPQTVESVRVVFSFTQESGAVRKLHELQLLSPMPTSGKTPDWHVAAQELQQTLRIQGVNRLYATRWVANSIADMSHGAIWTNCGDDLHPKETGCPRPHKPPAPVVLDHATALLASPSGTASMREVLEMSMIAMREIPCGPLGTLFIPKTIQRVSLDQPSGILFDADLPVLLPEPGWMASRISILEGEAATSERAARDLARVLSSNPASLEAAIIAPEWALTDADKKAIAEKYIPRRFRAVDFRNGNCRWIGTDIDAQFCGMATFRPGETVRLRHFWEFWPNNWATDFAPEHGKFRVFTHFVADNGYRFQDDFDFALPPEGADMNTDKYGGLPMHWHNDREITIPHDAPEGEYEMRIGLYDVVYSSRRLGAASQDPYTRTRRGAAIVPGFLHITRHPAGKENAE